MTDHDALLRAICENPREDTPRLAFADWLEENGQPERAAFVRTDIAMARRDEWDAERLRWAVTPMQINRFTWIGSAPLLDYRHTRLSWCGGQLYRRGFPWAVEVGDLGEFSERAAELFVSHPVEYLAFHGELPRLDWFVSQPWFRRVTGLEWSQGRYSGQAIRSLLEAPHVALEEVAAHNLALAPDGLRAVLESAVGTNLTRLSLVGNSPQVIPVALESLAGRPPVPSRLRALTIRVNGLNRDAVVLARGFPDSLRILDVSASGINSAGAQEFAGVGTTSGLRMLTLASNGIGNAGATALFTSPYLAGLKVLDLSYCQVGDEALRALLENSPLADGLNLLNLTGSPASGDMKQAVRNRMGDRVRL